MGVIVLVLALDHRRRHAGSSLGILFYMSPLSLEAQDSENQHRINCCLNECCSLPSSLNIHPLQFMCVYPARHTQLLNEKQIETQASDTGSKLHPQHTCGGKQLHLPPAMRAKKGLAGNPDDAMMGQEPGLQGLET